MGCGSRGGGKVVTLEKIKLAVNIRRLCTRHNQLQRGATSLDLRYYWLLARVIQRQKSKRVTSGTADNSRSAYVSRLRGTAFELHDYGVTF
jgi:hypothetical protein